MKDNISNKKLRNNFSLSLDDLEGEIWIDAVGFDGIYEVSNLGRIKSLGRWVSNGKSERWVKERIRKQAQSKDGRLSCPFSVGGTTYPINIPELIYLSFNRNECLNGYVIAHLNKKPYDNRLSNLKKITIKDSRKISEKLGNLKPMPTRGELKYTRENTFYENGVLKEKRCKLCNTIKSISLFDKFRNTCRECRNSLRRKTYKKKSIISKRNKKGGTL